MSGKISRSRGKDQFPAFVRSAFAVFQLEAVPLLVADDFLCGVRDGGLLEPDGVVPGRDLVARDAPEFGRIEVVSRNHGMLVCDAFVTVG
jgi:hypothetical protein